MVIDGRSFRMCGFTAFLAKYEIKIIECLNTDATLRHFGK